MKAFVKAVSLRNYHSLTKNIQHQIMVIQGQGVQGDAHFGRTVQHRSRVARNPDQPNLRQVHLIQHELIISLQKQGFDVAPGTLGENITTSGVPLLDFPEGTELAIGKSAILRITGLRNPCKQLDDYQKGLMQAVLDRDHEGNLIRKAGVMAVVTQNGLIKPEDGITCKYPNKPYLSLKPV